MNCRNVARLDLGEAAAPLVEVRRRALLERAAVADAGRLAEAAGSSAGVGVEPVCGVLAERLAALLAVLAAADVCGELRLDRPRLGERVGEPLALVPLVAVDDVAVSALVDARVSRLLHRAAHRPRLLEAGATVVGSAVRSRYSSSALTETRTSRP